MRASVLALQADVADSFPVASAAVAAFEVATVVVVGAVDEALRLKSPWGQLASEKLPLQLVFHSAFSVAFESVAEPAWGVEIPCTGRIERVDRAHARNRDEGEVACALPSGAPPSQTPWPVVGG